MILDNLDQVMASYAPTDYDGSPLFQSYIDRLAKQEDGSGDGYGAYIRIAVAPTSGGSATVGFQIIGHATDPTFASGNTVLADTGLIAIASLPLGYQLRLRAKRANFASVEPTTGFLRYLTILVNIGVADLTAGTFDGWLTPNFGAQDNLSYAAGYTV